MTTVDFSRLDDKKCLLLCGDSRQVLTTLHSQVDLIFTSPPYAHVRTQHYDSVAPDEFADWLASFHSVWWNSLKPEGSLVINLKDKVVNGVRHRFVWHAIEQLSALGWLCIDDYVWSKTNAFPGYWCNRFRDAWEYVFHLAKTPRPFMQQAAVKVPIGDWAQKRLKRVTHHNTTRQASGNYARFGTNLSHWLGKTHVLPSNVLPLATTHPCRGHPAVFPTRLPAFFIHLFSPPNGVVLDPFSGSGTTGVAAAHCQRRAILVDNQKNYCDLAYQRLQKEASISTTEIFYPSSND